MSKDLLHLSKKSLDLSLVAFLEKKSGMLPLKRKWFKKEEIKGNCVLKNIGQF